ncbi:MAG: thiamine pyrophosphate-dependent enzyme [Thermomicrobium sp.]|nr:thiamine pyrophosphate-dependent enzyme [Thermomicrobium sp.]
MTVEWLGYCLEEFRRENPDLLIIDEAITSQVPLFCQIQSTTFGSWFQSGGSGLGWGLGAAIGAKLAAPDRTVLGLIGDGSFLFGVPEASLWIAREANAPILVVVVNNACYNATKRPLVAAYPEGYSVRTEQFVGIDLAPTPRFDLLAQSVDAYGERVDAPDQILPALRRALDCVRNGQSAVLDVILARP